MQNVQANPVAFNGIWETKNILKKEIGNYNRDKIMYTVHEFIYHPYEGETKDAVQKEVDKHFWGRSFSLWDKFDGQHKADLLQMNFIKIGDSVKKEDVEKYKALGLKEDFFGGVSDNNSFWEAYSNETYSPYDINIMSKDYVEDVAKRLFDLKI